MELSVERRNEIAYLLFEANVKEHGLSCLDPEKVAASLRKKIEGQDVSLEEVQEFARCVILPLVNEAYPKPKTDDGVVSLIRRISQTG